MYERVRVQCDTSQSKRDVFEPFDDNRKLSIVPKYRPLELTVL